MRLVFLDPSYTDFCVSGAEVFQLQPTVGHPSFFHLVIDQQVGNSKTNRWPGRRSRQFLHLISDHGSGVLVSRRNCFFVNGDLTNGSARPSRAWNRASTETTGNTGKWKRRRQFRPQTFACRQLQSACEPWNFQYHGERLKEFSNARILRLQLYCGPHLWWRLYHWSLQLQIAWDTCDTGPRASSYLSFSVQVKSTVVCLCFDYYFHIFSRPCELRATGSSVLII